MMFPFWKLSFYSRQPVGSLEHSAEAFGLSPWKEEVPTPRAQPESWASVGACCLSF